MNYQPHELRVIKEQIDLDMKIFALSAYIKTGSFQELSLTQRGLLRRQQIVMQSYSDVLRLRVNLFKESE